ELEINPTPHVRGSPESTRLLPRHCVLCSRRVRSVPRSLSLARPRPVRHGADVRESNIFDEFHDLDGDRFEYSDDDDDDFDVVPLLLSEKTTKRSGCVDSCKFFWHFFGIFLDFEVFSYCF